MDLGAEFYKKVKAKKPNWLVRGIISVDDLVYGFGTDTKILSRVFELLSFPFINEVANDHGYTVEVSSEQTVYPDFTLYKDKGDKNKIAVDVKSTYLRSAGAPFRFTLGSYTSFLRNNTKNIMYPYDEYSEHWVIGFVYERRSESSRSTDIVPLCDRAKLEPPFKNVEFFVQEKYKIAGESPGSGNTANIGSILGTFDEFKNGNGPFSGLGEKVFREYWANYGRFKPRQYSDLNGYLKWKSSRNE